MNLSTVTMYDHYNRPYKQIYWDIGGTKLNLEKPFEMQKILDERIIKEKGLEGQDLLPNKILALQVELGELVNERRGFKHWSTDQKPRYERKCHACNGEGRFPLHEDGLTPDIETEECLYCEGTGIEAKPILEEYVDCLHFILSIGIIKGIVYTDYEERWFKFESDITKQFNRIFFEIG